MSDESLNNEQNTASNEHLTIHVARKPNCLIKFDITVKPEAVEAAYQSAVKAVKKEVNIPGFRKGKAPDHFIFDKYSSVIQKECVDIALRTAFNEAIQLTNIHPLKDGLVKRPLVHECTREKGAHFVLEFEGRPVIPTVNPEELQMNKVPESEVSDEQRQNAIDNLLLQFMTYEPITDRGVEENDFVDVDVILLEEPPREVIKNQRTQVNQKGLPSWMKGNVIGLKAGEHAEGMTKQNSDHQQPDFESSPYRITVKAIWKGVPPEMNDDLAKKVGLQTIDELHQKIDERLKNELEDDIYLQKIIALEDQLVEKYPVDLPKTFIDSRKEQHLDNYLKRLEAGHVNPEVNDYSQLDKIVEKSTVRNLTLHFLLQRVAMENQLNVTDEDITHELSKQVALMPSGRSQIDINTDKDRLREQIQILAFERKVKQYLLDKAQWI
ncbi:MAG: trigger factor [Parachlamydia sp.]|jgi:trigger factor|nr:trigger factor [Parachlamydia sp.]